MTNPKLKCHLTVWTKEEIRIVRRYKKKSSRKKFHLEGRDQMRLLITQNSKLWWPCISIAATIVANYTTSQSSHEDWFLGIQTVVLWSCQLPRNYDQKTCYPTVKQNLYPATDTKRKKELFEQHLQRQHVSPDFISKHHPTHRHLPIFQL